MSSLGSPRRRSRRESSPKISSLVSRWENNTQVSSTGQTAASGSTGGKRHSSDLITSGGSTAENGSSSLRERKSRLVDQRWGKVLEENADPHSVESSNRPSRTDYQSPSGKGASKSKDEIVRPPKTSVPVSEGVSNRSDRKNVTSRLSRQSSVADMTSKWNDLISSDNPQPPAFQSNPTGTSQTCKSGVDHETNQESTLQTTRPSSFSGTDLDAQGWRQELGEKASQEPVRKRPMLMRGDSKVLDMAQKWDERHASPSSEQPSDRTVYRKLSQDSASSSRTPVGSVSSFPSQTNSLTTTPDPEASVEKMTDDEEDTISNRRTQGDEVNSVLLSCETAKTVRMESSSSVDEISEEDVMIKEDCGMLSNSQVVLSKENGLEDFHVSPARCRASTTTHRIQVAPQGRRKPTSNPVKMLQSRTDVRSELEPTPIGGKQIFTKSAQLAGYNVSLATAAVAGLAAKEDIKAVKLSSSGDSGVILWPQLLLIHIKGRRSLQVRLVEPVASSVNSGDSFILVDAAKRAVYQFIGKSANVVEKAKSSDIAHDLVHGKDCGSKAVQVSLVEEGKKSCSRMESAFWRCLGGETGSAKSPEHGGDDLSQEKKLASKVIVYRLSEDETELVIDEELSGKTLKVASLDHKQLFVFDFGAEMYVWTGRRASSDHRRKVPQLAQEIYDQGYHPGGDGLLSPRPSWGVFARMKAGGESVLFRSKFFDWPEPGKIIKTKTDGPAKKSSNSKTSNTPKPCDVLAMRAAPADYPGLMLELRNVGRGRGEAPCDDAVLGGPIVKTESVKKWLVKDNACIEVAESAYNDFFFEDAYIVRWRYTLHSERDNIRRGLQTMQLGGVHTAFFYWQGLDCRINEKGAVALITVDLAGSDGDPQVRVSQGHEPPAFIQLFDGGMSVHSGSSQTTASSDITFRLYNVHGQQEHEALLVQIPNPSYKSLRSRHAFVALDVSEKQIYTWHGDNASSFACKMATAAAKKLQARQCADNPWAFFQQRSDIETELEGCESPAFENVLGEPKMLLDSGLKLKVPPRFFLMTSITGQFVATELLPSWYFKAKPADFPALQSQLYDATQPALALVEAGQDIFVWAGWMKEQSEDERGTGNARSHWVKDKLLALKTAQAYVKRAALDTGKKYTVTMVTAGHEPDSFKALFPTWTDHADVQEFTAKIPPCSRLSPVPLDEEMELLCGTTYSWLVLKQRPLPDNLDVDSSVLENYLREEDFMAAFGKTKEDFFNLPMWKKLELKKKAGLF